MVCLVLLPLVGAFAVCASVEGGHRLVGRSNLQLHKERFGVFALWTWCIRGIDILPALFSTHHVVHLFTFQVLPCSHLAYDGELVGASVTRPLVVALIIELDDEAVGARWTEEHLR